MSTSYYIGTPGIPWGDNEKKAWFEAQTVKRSYQQDVVSKLKLLAKDFTLIQYGTLPVNPEAYPLFALHTINIAPEKPTVLITGGVHGYETSGVHGAIRFLATSAKHYEQQFNIIVLPCISPWGYETINRWNPEAIDPNRSFYFNSPSAEAAQAMACVNQLLQEHQINLLAHIDLHETTDTDNTEFRPALAARDAVTHDNWDIPDGFYLVGDTEAPQADFQRAIIKSVERVTHIAPADSQNFIIGEPLQQKGVINYATKSLGLCAGFSDASYKTTTEVYPDSPLVDDENCIEAQVAAVNGALSFLKTVQ